MTNPKTDRQYRVRVFRSTDDLPAPGRDAIPVNIQNAKKVSAC
jgi:hypothetical protein